MAEKVRDLVCGMEFDGDSASGILEYYDKIYYFCSLRCKDKFGREPEKYVPHEEKEWQLSPEKKLGLAKRENH